MVARRGDYVGELANYIRKNLKKGYTSESLRWALVDQGHSRLEVEKAMKKVQEAMAKDAPLLETKPEITYEVIEPRNAIVQHKKKPFWKRFLGL